MNNPIRLQGTRAQVTGMLWDQYVGNHSAGEVMLGYALVGDGTPESIEHYIAQLLDMWQMPDMPVIHWVDAGADFTLVELLSLYIGDHRDEWEEIVYLERIDS